MNNTLLANPSKLNMQTRPCFAAGKSVVLCLRKKPLRVIQAHQKKTPKWSFMEIRSYSAWRWTLQDDERRKWGDSYLFQKPLSKKDVGRSRALGFICSVGTRASSSLSWRVRTLIAPHSLLSSSRRSRKVILRTVRTAPARPRPPPPIPLPLPQQHGNL